MANLTNENKTDIVNALLKGMDTRNIAERLGLSLKSVNAFNNKLRQVYQAGTETIDYSQYVLDLVVEGKTEQEAYHMVYSTALEENFKSEEEFVKLLNGKKTAKPVQQHNVSAMNAEASAAAHEVSPYLKPSYVFSADGS